MKNDPIVEEVRKHRRIRAARFNFNIDAIADDAQKREGTCGHKVLKPRKLKGSGALNTKR